MDAKEYLQQIHWLNLRIKSHMKEREELMELATSLSSPQMGDRVLSSPSGNASFQKRLEKVWDLDETINAEIDLMVDLRMQIYSVIDSLHNRNYQLVLRYRYINGYSIEKIAEETDMNRKTISRWHKEGLEQIELPENPIII